MPVKILDRLVSQLKIKGYSEEAAHAIATSALIKSGNLEKDGSPTRKGVMRGNMSPAERAKSRAAKDSGRSTSDYHYNPKTNRATLRGKGRRGR